MRVHVTFSCYIFLRARFLPGTPPIARRVFARAGLDVFSLNEISLRAPCGDGVWKFRVEKAEAFVYLDLETGAAGKRDDRERRHGERVCGHHCRPDVHYQDREESRGIVRDNSVDASQTRQRPVRNTDDGQRLEPRPVCSGAEEQGIRLQRSVGSTRGRARARGHAENVCPKSTCPGTVAMQLSSGQTARVGVGRRVFRSLATGRHRGPHENSAGMRRHRRGSGSRSGRSPYQSDSGAKW